MYETKARYYIVASNQNQDNGQTFRILKIDRTVAHELNLTEDPTIYSKSQIDEVLSMIENGNKSTGGIHKVCDFYGLVGFVRFLEGYYMILIMKKSTVALIGGHYIYHIDHAQMIHIPGPLAKFERKPDESRYQQIFTQVDLSKNFYFSYSYDLTQTLQMNMTSDRRINDMFMWNHYLTRPIPSNSEFILPLVYGFVDQSKISVYGHNIFVTLIARRSRFFAGARFLKRGINEQGHVANDVETEQIVFDASTTFLSLENKRFAGYTSFVQHRGSIPLNWSQDTTGMATKPPIQLNFIDPYYTAAAKHFDGMMRRYGAPIIVLNLVKSNEKMKREAILLEQFTELIQYLNQFPPKEFKIHYIAWDMARASKSNDQDVITVLENIAMQVLETTGFFHSGVEPFINTIKRSSCTTTFSVEQEPIKERRQCGILRTNCIDCLDRTNAAQFVVAKEALGHQLYALGVISQPSVPFDSDAVNLLNVMYHDHGDTIALQYGGSHLVNTMETYRKISPWTSHSRDMIESIKRYYSNSFTDSEKQDAMNLFLGNFQPEVGKPPLWELLTDYFLHNPKYKIPVGSYMEWWSGSYESMKPYGLSRNSRLTNPNLISEYYCPSQYTTFTNLLTFDMMSTSTRALMREDNDPSPFSVRTNNLQQPTRYLMMYSLNIGGVKRWLTLSNSSSPDRPAQNQLEFIKSRDSKESSSTSSTLNRNININNPTSVPSPRSSQSLAQRNLEPQVLSAEMREYQHYVKQFQPNHVSISSSSSLSSFNSLESFQQEKIIASHPDFDCFYSFVNASLTCKEQIQENDLNMYSSFVHSSDQTSRFIMTRNDAFRYDGYVKWINGRLSV